MLQRVWKIEKAEKKSVAEKLYVWGIYAFLMNKKIFSVMNKVCAYAL